jgi:hypothetical protein
MKKILLLGIVFTTIHTQNASAKIWNASDKVSALTECTYGQATAEVITISDAKQLGNRADHNILVKNTGDSKLVAITNSAKLENYFSAALPDHSMAYVTLLSTSFIVLFIISIFRKFSL